MTRVFPLIMLRLPLALLLLPLLLRAESPERALAEAMRRGDEAGVRAAVADAVRALGDRAGEPEVPDEYRKLPDDPAWLTPAEARAALAPAVPRLLRLGTWRTGMDPATLRVPLRAPASRLACAAVALGAGLQGAEDLRAAARGDAAFLRWAQEQAGSGCFPFPAVRGRRDDAAFAAADAVLARLDAAGESAQAVKNGWVADDLGNGGLQFDNAEAGVALLEWHAVEQDPRDLAAARRAGDWAIAQPCCPNWNYNAFSVHLLAMLHRATGDARYLDAARAKARLGVLPGQLTSGPRAGRWVDPHNARPAYHYILLRGLAALWTELPPDDPLRPAVREALRLGLAQRNADFTTRGAPNQDKAMETLLLAREAFAADPAFLRDTGTTAALNALAGLVSRDLRDGKLRLGPAETARFLRHASNRADGTQ